ncbi:MAG: Spy/CpxP family protein refolding chaperone [Pyrinomonadaceae bacterium]
MLRTKLMVSALIIGLPAFGSMAFGQQTQPNNPAPGVQQSGRVRQARRGMLRRARIGRLRALRQVNLTDAQRQQARTIVENHVNATKAQREELRKLMEQRRAGTLTAEGQTRAQQLRQQLMEGRKGVHAQMQNVLTAEQKAKLEEMRQTRRANRERLGRRKPRVN